MINDYALKYYNKNAGNLDNVEQVEVYKFFTAEDKK